MKRPQVDPQGARENYPWRVKETELVEMTPNGDFILVIESEAENKSRKFLSSSVALGLASPVFFNMFNSGFKECLEVKSGQCPEIALKEDDVDAMTLILLAVHHKTGKVPATLKPESLARLAIQSDKYDLTQLLTPWVSQWFSVKDEVTNDRDLGFLLLAAHIFQSPNFKDIKVYAAIQGSLKIFNEDMNEDVMDRLPEECMDEVRDLMNSYRKQIRHLIEYGERRLRRNKEYYSKNTQKCKVCKTVHPLDIAICPNHCGWKSLSEQFCTPQKRAWDYFAILGDSTLWPSRATRCSPVAKLVRSLAEARAAGAAHHDCAAGSDCPLKSIFTWIYEHTIDKMARDLDGRRDLLIAWGVEECRYEFAGHDGFPDS